MYFYGDVVQKSRTLACQARGRGFESPHLCQLSLIIYNNLSFLIKDRHTQQKQTKKNHITEMRAYIVTVVTVVSRV